MNKLSGVYQITNKTNGKKYVGSSADINKRWHEHLLALKHGKHENKNIQSALDEQGQDCFEFSVLEHCDESLLIQREQFYIDALKPEYNLSPTAGSVKGTKRSQETRNKISIARTGKKHTQETKRKISVALMGNTYAHAFNRTQEYKNKMSVALIGNTNALGAKHAKRTQEYKDKMSIALRVFWARLNQ